MSTSTPAGTVGRRLGLRRPAAPAARLHPTAVPAVALDVTIVVPTRNEAGNIAELLLRLNVALGSTRAEILFVDDSDDDTPATILAEAQRSAIPVRLVHRGAGDRTGRLGGAVVLGFRHANAPWALVIDGDLQHPPEAVPALVAATGTPGVDLVYGTRYAAAGNASGLGGHTRAMVSAWSTKLAKAVFPGRLKGISDPMSGFFAVRLAALEVSRLRPSGYKVLLDILALSRLRGTIGVPFSFQPRCTGASKATFAEGVRYLLQLLALRLGTSVATLTRLLAFLTVGLSGVGVNTVVLWGLSTGWPHQSYLLASLTATNVAVGWNFALLELLVFRKSRKHSSWQAFLRFWWLNMLLLPVQLGLLAVLVEKLSLRPLPANVVALGVVFLLRYLVTTMWVFQRAAGQQARVGAAAERLAFASEAIALSAQARARDRVGGDLHPATRGRGALRTTNAAPLSERLGLSPGGSIIPVSIRLGLALAATLLAFPAMAAHAGRLVAGGGLDAGVLVLVLATALTLIALRAAPLPGDPDVHDRQLDFILAIPALGAALFLAFAWPTRLLVAGPVGSRQVLAFSFFFAGAVVLLLGTRCAARLRRLLYAPLVMLPVLMDAPVVAMAVVLVFVLLTGRTAADARTSRRGVVGAEIAKLPRWQPTLVAVVAVAAVLGVLAVATSAASVPAPTPSAGAR